MTAPTCTEPSNLPPSHHPPSTPAPVPPGQVTEVALVQFFADCGTVLDCRLCSALGGSSLPGKYAFLEFLDLCGAQAVSAFCLSLFIHGT